MGNSNSRDAAIQAQEVYVKQRMKDPDIQRLSQIPNCFFHDKKPKYNKKQVEGYLRQVYNDTRKANDYVLDTDLHNAGVKRGL